MISTTSSQIHFKGRVGSTDMRLTDYGHFYKESDKGKEVRCACLSYRLVIIDVLAPHTVMLRKARWTDKLRWRLHL
jgi:hypothetical protein